MRTRPALLIICLLFFHVSAPAQRRPAVKVDPLAALPDVMCVSDTQHPRLIIQFQPRGATPDNELTPEDESKIPFLAFMDADAVDFVALRPVDIKLTTDAQGNLSVEMTGERTVVNPALERPPVRVSASFRFRGQDFNSGKGSGNYDILADLDPLARHDEVTNFIRDRRDFRVAGSAFVNPFGCQAGTLIVPNLRMKYAAYFQEMVAPASAQSECLDRAEEFILQCYAAGGTAAGCTQAGHGLFRKCMFDRGIIVN